ncbi:MAG: ADP-forming succinate--CoA ligase subunit beta [Alphaproteobacteria bacterium]|nr:ADP-forming succinate--CoA ligase subunit beta [Alphaproteobacteria bacterium]MDD9919983.1 ADP-forming succinate--CoA ligase subunit beta [Alphaproteobacteria bacterium]
MNIHEYQAKAVLKKFGVAVPEGVICQTAEEAEAATKQLGTAVVAVKAQVHAGGRGKAGGVKICKSAEEAKATAASLLGTNLVTHQTDANGQPINRVYVEAGTDIAQELYVSMLLDRASSKNIVMASTEGGMDIEEVAEKTPEKITTISVDPLTGLMPYQARQLAFSLGLKGEQIKHATKFFLNLYKAYIDTDAAMLEINPLVVTGDDQIVALDGKMNFDSNALFRHPDIAELDDPTQQDSREVEAAKWDLNYIALDGEIGCMVNGAGLAMATMDIIKHFGSSPANFLDVGGSATEERVTAAFKIILSDPQVKGILVNIFGGIMKCDVIANGVVAAAKEVQLSVPLVVRLEGTNVQLGKDIMAKSGLPITSADTLAEAAQAIVNEVNKSKAA